MTTSETLDSLQRFCEKADDGRCFVEVEGFLELIRPVDDDYEPLGLAVAKDDEDGLDYLVLKVHVDPEVLTGDFVDAPQVVQAAADYLPIGNAMEFYVSHLDCFGDPDNGGVLRPLSDEDLDAEEPVPVELFGVQLSPSEPLADLGNDLVQRLVDEAPFELSKENVNA